MDSKIIIIHPSEIYRKGLATILKGFVRTELIQLSSVRNLQDYLQISNSFLILIAEAGMYPSDDLTGKLAKSNTLRTIAILAPGSIPEKDAMADLLIEHTISASELCRIIDDMMHSFPGNSHRGSGTSELTGREKDVLKLVALGHTNKEIADKLFISIHTVISHRQNITEKLGIKSISGLTVYAIINKLIDTEHIDPRSLI